MPMDFENSDFIYGGWGFVLVPMSVMQLFNLSGSFVSVDIS